MAHQPFFIPSAIFAALGIPLILGLIPMNRFYGVRTPRSMVSGDVWLRVNRVAGWGVVVASGLYFAVAKLMPYRKGTPGDFRVWLVHLAVFAGSLVVALVVVNRYNRSIG